MLACDISIILHLNRILFRLYGTSSRYMNLIRVLALHLFNTLMFTCRFKYDKCTMVMIIVCALLSYHFVECVSVVLRCVQFATLSYALALELALLQIIYFMMKLSPQ